MRGFFIEPCSRNQWRFACVAPVNLSADLARRWRLACWPAHKIPIRHTDEMMPLPRRWWWWWLLLLLLLLLSGMRIPDFEQMFVSATCQLPVANIKCCLFKMILSLKLEAHCWSWFWPLCWCCIEVPSTRLKPPSRSSGVLHCDVVCYVLGRMQVTSDTKNALNGPKRNKSDSGDDLIYAYNKRRNDRSNKFAAFVAMYPRINWMNHDSWAWLLVAQFLSVSYEADNNRMIYFALLSTIFTRFQRMPNYLPGMVVEARQVKKTVFRSTGSLNNVCTIVWFIWKIRLLKVTLSDETHRKCKPVRC